MALKNSPELQSYIVENVSRPSTEQHLGSGSYGTVEQFLVNGLKCAGKTLHKNLFIIEKEGSEVFVRKFVAECKLMSNLRHPNIVQFLGVSFSDTDKDLPVVLMELMPTSLRSVIENYPNFSLPLKQSILKDVACGMSYLHGRNPPVIHRDLTATNVLMTSAMVAKISDFGNSRIVTISPDQLQKTMTSVPGTPVYLPPEAFEPQPSYNSKLDVFSFGQIALYTIVQEFPSPTNATVLDPSTKALIALSEVQRRQTFVDKLDPLDSSCPALKELTLNCLDNDPDKRPTSLEIFNTLDKVCSENEHPYITMTRIDLLAALEEKTKAQSSVSEQALEFGSVYRAKDKVLEAREEENALQVEFIAKLQEEIKSKEKALETKEKEFAMQLRSQKATFTGMYDGLYESKEKVIHAKDEEIKELVKIIEGFNEQTPTPTTIRNTDSKLTAEIEALQQKLHISKLEIDGWERLCQARNQQLEAISKEKSELEEAVKRQLEQMGEDIDIEELCKSVSTTETADVVVTSAEESEEEVTKSDSQKPEPQPEQSDSKDEGEQEEGKKIKRKHKKKAATKKLAPALSASKSRGIRSLKIVVVGDGASGKTSLLYTYTTNSFPDNYIPTVFEKYSAKVIINGTPWKLELWDTAGQPDYDRLRPLSYPQTDCFVILHNIGNHPDSLENVWDKWVPEISHHQPKAPFIIVGNKSDLRENPKSHRKPATYAEGKAMADKVKAAAYVECSAKNYQGVKEVFDNVIHAVLEQSAKRKDKSNCVIQ